MGSRTCCESGTTSVAVAPFPGPSLSNESFPPRSCAASTLVCRPKPWPSLRVVKPYVKRCLRFSGEIPKREQGALGWLATRSADGRLESLKTRR